MRAAVDQPQHDPARRRPLAGAEREQHRIRVTGEPALDAAELLERARRDHAALGVARLPQLRERELQERQRTRVAGDRADQRVDHRLRLVAHALRARRPDDGLAQVRRRQHAQEVEPARHRRAELRQRRDAGQEVAAHREQRLDPGHPGRDRRERLGRALRLRRRAQRHQLLELVDHDEQPLVAGGPPAAHQLVGGPAAGRIERERVAQRGPRRAPRRDRHRAPAPSIAEPAREHRRHHARVAHRRLADPGVSDDDQQRLAAQPIDEHVDIGAAPEEQPAVGGIERAQAAVRVALGDGGRADDRRLELVRHRRRRRRPRVRIERQAPHHQPRERRVRLGRQLLDGPDLSGEHRGLQLVEIGVRARRHPREQLVEHRAERVQIRPRGRRLAAPDLRRGVARRAEHRQRASRRHHRRT